MSELRQLKYDSKVVMAQVIAGLLQGRTVTDVAETLGISRMRVTKWYREDPEFLKLLDDTTDAVVDSIKAEVVGETSQRMSELLPKAVSVLSEGMESDKQSERTAAAAHVMRFSGFGSKKEPPKPAVSAEVLIRGARGPATGD